MKRLARYSATFGTFPFPTELSIATMCAKISRASARSAADRGPAPGALGAAAC